MITDKQIEDAYLQQYERGILKKEVRSYEVSIWTLQDEFITVLKWSNLEHKGKIQNPKLIIADDGTEEFTFSIPHYYDDNGIIIENPCWQHTVNGNLMVNMRKIKVIFNKDVMSDIDDQVFELLITKVTDSHSGDIVGCDVTCEGLAFHELGKQGYKYSLSLEEYMTDLEKWHNDPYTSREDMIRPTVQYWCKKIGLEPAPENKPMEFGQWYYAIDMKWESNAPDSFIRDKKIVYEDAYVSQWNDNLLAQKVEASREKERIVEIQESNIYNITQEIAKQFGIFCRYKYMHDENFHIIGRIVIFFNNFIHDTHIMAFTYPYSSKGVTREIDSTDTITKMYVRSMQDETVINGEVNIMDCTANRTLDDYILNFDYLKDTENLTEAQAAAIPEYEKAIRKLNLEIIPLENQIYVLENLKTDYEAKITTYNNSITIDKEQIAQNSALMQELIARYGENSSEGTNYIEAYTNAHPDQGTIIRDADGRNYINLVNSHKKGINTNSLHIYRTYSSLNHTLSNELNNFYFTYDEYGNPKAIYGSDIHSSNNSSRVYMTYSYEPHLYYEAIVKTWTEKLGKDEENLEKYKKLLSNIGDPLGVEQNLNNANLQKEELIASKEKCIAEFNHLMGPALREGYWQPEDYQDYGENHYNTHNLPVNGETNLDQIDTKTDFTVGWDADLFDEEQPLYYTYSITEDQICYPCINISSIFNQVANLIKNNDQVGVMFNVNYVTPPSDITEAFSNIKYIKSYIIGSEALFVFVKNHSSTIYPALLLVGAKNLSDQQLAHLHEASSYISIGVLQTNLNTTNSTVNVTIKNGSLIQLSHNLNSVYWQFDGINYTNSSFKNNYEIVYPRIKFSSVMLKTSSDLFYLYYNHNLLTEYEDFYINIKTVKPRSYFPEYYITIKPMSILRSGVLQAPIEAYYVLSNASTAIYLDALEIAKENAYPKVSYTVEPNVLNPDIISTLYQKLNWLVMINDHMLKFKNVFGYISKLTLDLDHPWNDAIEVKNYTNKFEDMFSTILASSEQMQRNNGILNSLSRGTYVLSQAGLKNSLFKTDQELINYLSQHIIASPPVQNYLSTVFVEASNILGDANHALGQSITLTQEGATVLSGFAREVQNNLIPHVYKQTNKPTSFKKGDIWIQVEWDNINNREVEVARYLAMSDSTDARPGYGWSKTHNGSLAQLAGPGIDIDPETGTIELNSNHATIRGEDTVEIMGVEVNIGSDSTNPNHYGGINLVASYYDNSTDDFYKPLSAQVNIHPEEISMFGSKITMLTGNNKDITAIQMSGPEGLYLGSSQHIQFFSGGLNQNGTAAVVDINPQHIIFGVNNQADSGSSVSITEDYVVIASGKVINTATNNSKIITGVTGTNTGLIGAKFTKNSIGMATLNNGIINALLINDGGITLGSGGIDLRQDTNSLRSILGGAYVRIAATGIDIGSSGYLYIDTTNFTINSNATNTPMLELKYDKKDQNNNVIDTITGIRFSQNQGLYVHGNIVNDQLAIINSEQYYIGNNPYGPGIYLTNNNINGNAPAFYIGDTAYYAWEYNSETYYINNNDDRQHEVVSGDTVYKYESALRAVAPKWARAQEEIEAPEGYKYIVYYITTNGKDVALDSEGQRIRYDGSSSPNAQWYTKLSAEDKIKCAHEYRSGSAKLVIVPNMINKVFTRNLDVTFSVVAETGYVTLSAGKLGDCNVNPQGLTGGNIIGCNVTNTNLTGCTIENGYNTGYYGRCFYDYNFNRDTGILVLKRIDGTNEVIDIKTAINVATEGGSTSDSGASGSGGDVYGCSTCEGTCTGSCSSCTGTCSGGCSSGCENSCKTFCLHSCTGGCTDECTDVCTIVCTGTCGGNCGGSCGYGCGGNCHGECTQSCEGSCSGSCEGSSSGCAGCASGCSGGCTNACTAGCATSCATACDMGCRGMSVPLE